MQDNDPMLRKITKKSLDSLSLQAAELPVIKKFNRYAGKRFPVRGLRGIKQAMRTANRGHDDANG